ncbi:MAG: hypothetical protein ACI4JD_07055 [Ruminococcus sp.]
MFDERLPQYDYYRKQLQDILTPEEYAAARENTLNAHYTPQIIIDSMYKAIKNMNLPHDSRKCDVSYSHVTGEFEVMNAGIKKDLNLAETTTYGTADLNMYQLAEKILNQRRIVVQREKPYPKDPSKTITKTDPRATKIALEKAKIIRDEFKKWIFADPERKEKYERKYNDIFNSLV